MRKKYYTKLTIIRYKNNLMIFLVQKKGQIVQKSNKKSNNNNIYNRSTNFHIHLYITKIIYNQKINNKIRKTIEKMNVKHLKKIF